MNYINKYKQKPNDLKMTPDVLAKNCIDNTPFTDKDILFDGFRGKGAFYKQFPLGNEIMWAELDEDIDFFENKKPYDWLISNPPWSKITDILKLATKQARKGIALLIGCMNLTPKRIEILNKAGFNITHLHFATVTGWLGTCVYIVAERGKPQVISFDRAPFQMPGEEGQLFKEKMSNYGKVMRKKKNELLDNSHIKKKI